MIICKSILKFTLTPSWVKVSRIIPEFKILRLKADFPQKVSLKMLNSGGNNSFSDLVSVYLKVSDH